MKAKSRILTSLAAVSFMFSQSGCLLGLITAPMGVGLPLVISGSVISFAGLGATGYGFSEYSDFNPEIAKIGALTAIFGGLLGEENLDYEVGLNPLPMDTQFANHLGVSLQDLETYNDDLNHIQVVAKMLRQDIHETWNYLVEHKLKTLGWFDSKDDPTMNAVAKKYGFENATEMLQIIHQEIATPAMIERFAQSHWVNLTPSEAKILLQLVFKVKV